MTLPAETTWRTEEHCNQDQAGMVVFVLHQGCPPVVLLRVSRSVVSFPTGSCAQHPAFLDAAMHHWEECTGLPRSSVISFGAPFVSTNDDGTVVKLFPGLWAGKAIGALPPTRIGAAWMHLQCIGARRRPMLLHKGVYSKLHSILLSLRQNIVIYGIDGAVSGTACGASGISDAVTDDFHIGDYVVQVAGKACWYASVPCDASALDEVHQCGVKGTILGPIHAATCIARDGRRLAVALVPAPRHWDGSVTHRLIWIVLRHWLFQGLCADEGTTVHRAIDEQTTSQWARYGWRSEFMFSA